jgi:hypothetical protein
LASFADDVGLLGTTLEEVKLIVNGYHCWCHLLRLTLNLEKTQIWSRQNPESTRGRAPWNTTATSLSWTVALLSVRKGAWMWILWPGEPEDSEEDGTADSHKKWQSDPQCQIWTVIESAAVLYG